MIKIPKEVVDKIRREVVSLAKDVIKEMEREYPKHQFYQAWKDYLAKHSDLLHGD